MREADIKVAVRQHHDTADGSGALACRCCHLLKSVPERQLRLPIRAKAAYGVDG